MDKDNESALYGLALSLASAKDFRRAKAFLDKARTCPCRRHVDVA